MIQNFFQSCDYENGYSKAITDIKNFFENHSSSMKMWKLYNSKDILSLLTFIEKERHIFRENGGDIELGFKKEGKNTIFFLSEET